MTYEDKARKWLEGKVEVGSWHAVLAFATFLDSKYTLAHISTGFHDDVLCKDEDCNGRVGLEKPTPQPSQECKEGCGLCAFSRSNGNFGGDPGFNVAPQPKTVVDLENKCSVKDCVTCRPNPNAPQPVAVEPVKWSKVSEDMDYEANMDGHIMAIHKNIICIGKLLERIANERK